MVQTTGSSRRLNPSPSRGSGNRATPFRRPSRGSPHFVRVTGGLHHRLISNVPSGQLLSSNPLDGKLIITFSLARDIVVALQI